MNAKQLTAFRTIMQQGSMSDAARQLGVSQPAISRLIRDLEQSLGFSLFERRHSRLAPTPAARAFDREVQRHFSGFERLGQVADQIRMMKSGQLRLGATPALVQSVLPAIVGRFARGREALALSLGAEASDELIARVAAHQFDLALVQLPADLSDVVAGPAYRVDCVCIAPAGHRFASLSRVRAEDLDREPLIAVGGPEAPTRQRIERLLREALVRPDQAFEAGQALVAQAMVREGLGVALVDPFSARLLDGSEGLVRPFEPALPFCFGFIHPPGRTPAALEEAFIDSFEAGLGRSMVLQPIEPALAAQL